MTKLTKTVRLGKTKLTLLTIIECTNEYFVVYKDDTKGSFDRQADVFHTNERTAGIDILYK